MLRHNQNSSQSATYTNVPLHKTQTDRRKSVEQVNGILTRLCEAVLPQEPYLVSVPSNVPYNHSRRYIPTWQNGTPFAKEEEQLQYLSFIPSTNEETLLNVVGGWSDEKGNLLPYEDDEALSPKSKPATNQPSPAADAPLKKISLDQYKNKVKGEVDMATDTPPRRDMEKQADKVNGVKVEMMPDLTETKIESPISPGSNGKKRSREGGLVKDPNLRGGAVLEQSKVAKRDSLSPRPVKKPKLETAVSPRKQEPTSTTETPKLPTSRAAIAPALRPPTLPAKEEAESSLPPLLSPTIPPSIQEFLDIESSKFDKAVDRRRTDTVKTLLSTAGLDDITSGKTPGLLPANNGNRIRSDSAHSVRSNPPAVNGLNRVAALAKSPSRGSTPTRNGASPGPRQRHTIFLKYGKRNRKRVEALLKFAPRPRKVRPDTAAPPISDSVPMKRKLETIPEASASSDGPKESVLDGVAKHQKARPTAVSVSERPITPIPADLNSPFSTSHHAHHWSTFSTPKKDVKSTAMQRIVSSEGTNEAQTPHADRLSTPQPLTNKASPSAPTSAPSAPSNNREEWTALGKKYFDLGRKIKKEGTSFGAEASSGEISLSIVLLIEGLLCFMINTFAISVSSTRSSNDPGWHTIIPYLDFVLYNSRKVPHLHGLTIQLGALCRQHVQKYEMERLGKEPLPDEQSASAPTPGSDGNTKTGEDSERAKQKYLDFRDHLISNTRRCQAAWLEGSRLLSPEVLREEFPITWKRRATDFSLRGSERPQPRELGGSFFLPLDGNASALEGIRYAVEVLQEWSEREKVDWRCRIEL